MPVSRQMLLGFTRISTELGKTDRAMVEVKADKLRLLGANGQYELLHGEYQLSVGGRASGLSPAATTEVSESLRATLRVI